MDEERAEQPLKGGWMAVGINRILEQHEVDVLWQVIVHAVLHVRRAGAWHAAIHVAVARRDGKSRVERH